MITIKQKHLHTKDCNIIINNKYAGSLDWNGEKFILNCPSLVGSPRELDSPADLFIMIASKKITHVH